MTGINNPRADPSKIRAGIIAFMSDHNSREDSC
jgi:hypothetical protein